jgi:hypothetical protein
MAITSIPDKRTGKQSYFRYGGTTIPIYRVNVRVTRNVATCTDSSDYDEQADLIGPTQIPVSAICEGTIEGRYRQSTTPSTLIENLFTGVTAVPCIFGLDSQTVVGSGTFDITDYTQDMPIEDVVNYSCTVRSNGLFRPNQL